MSLKKIKDKLQDWAEKTTFHGVQNLVTSERTPTKIIWVICLVLSTCYCGYVLTGNITDFLNYEVETVIEITRDANADFPTVSFCSLQICGLSSNDKTPSIDQMILDYFNATGNLTQDQLNEKLRNLTSDSFVKIARDNFLKFTDKTELSRIFNQINTSIKNSIISCQYSSEFCYENDFEYFQLNEFQKCYRFNSGRNFNGEKAAIRKARRYGKNYGLQLELFVGLPLKCKSPFRNTFGLVLYVHNNTYAVSEDSYGIQIAPGSETNIAIDRTFVIRMPDPFNDCVNNVDISQASNEVVKNTFEISGSYTQQSCLQICYQNYLVGKYNCFDESLPYFKNTAVKKCPTMIESLNNSIYTNRESFYEEKQDKECLEKCPVECEFVNYDTTVSSSQFPTATYSEVLVFNENISSNFDSIKGENQFDLVKSSVLSVNVFYKNDLVTQIREKPSIGVEEFVSNIGGTMGLFLGISLLSLVEIFEFMFQVVLISIERFIHKLKTPAKATIGFNIGN